MDGCGIPDSGNAVLAQTLNAVERLEAASEWTSPIGGAGWFWIFLVLLVLGGAGIVVGVVAYRRWRHLRRQKEQVARRADQLGLDERERYVLAAVVKAGKLRNVEATFTSAVAFERSVAALMRSQRVVSMSEKRRETIAGLVESLRAKLGLDRPDPGAAAPAAPAAEVEIAEGDELRVVHRGQAVELAVRVAGSTDDELIVQPNNPVDCHPGETWLVRYTKDGTMWEFDASVRESDDGRIHLGRTGRPRFINRRRFPRVPTRRPAQVATFPFWRENMSLGSGDFVAGEVVELGGPGLRVEAPVEVAPGERVLLALKLGEDQVVEALGKVRRTGQGAGAESVLVVELLGLSEEEIATLAHETNLAARANARQAAEQAAGAEAGGPDEPEGPGD